MTFISAPGYVVAAAQRTAQTAAQTAAPTAAPQFTQPLTMPRGRGPTLEE